MIIWTPTVLSVLYACVMYFCICTCSAQLSMFDMERRSRNTLIIIIIVQESRLYCGDFSRSSHTSDLKIGTPVATLPEAWHSRVGVGTGKVESWICRCPGT